MPTLILLNGPPASGKSTLAVRLADAHPLMLALDVDAVRGMLGAWIDHPNDAGLAARRLALSMARTHLAEGHDVIVPQFIARERFALELEAVADEAGARFVEIALMIDREEMLQAFSARSAAPENAQHHDAQRLVDRSGGIDALRESYDRYVRFLEARPNARYVSVIRGDVQSTLRVVKAAVRA